MALSLLSILPVTQAEILLTAEDFSIFGGTAITSTGTLGTIISNGDVGLSPGATSGITGFPPAIIINGSIVPTGATTAQARTDLMTAQMRLGLMPSDSNLGTMDLGGMVLTSGVYTFNSAAALTGNLVLDGQGMANAYWVFQIGTALTTSANSTVSVINYGAAGGSDYGIFWNAGAEIIIGADNAILGNYLSGTSITLGSRSSGSARALALAAVTLDQNVINTYGGPLSSDWTGGLMYDPMGNIVPIPEPSNALLASVALLAFLSRRRRNAHL